MTCKLFWAFLFFLVYQATTLFHLVPCIRRIVPLSSCATSIAHQTAMQEAELRRGPWFEEEDERLIAAVTVLGERRWDALAKASGLRRSGKSCRLRWMNYLRPNLKHGHISAEEEDLIIQLQKQLGNRWSRIARRLPGRTDNEIKNYWRSHLRKKALVLEQEHSNGNMNNCLQNPMVAIQEEASQSSSSGDCSSEKDDNLATSAECSDTLELSNLGIACSPYETRLTDWISNWSNEQCTTEDEVRYCHPEWIFGYNETSIWDGSFSLWNMDQT